jgi:hypothetical protein
MSSLGGVLEPTGECNHGRWEPPVIVAALLGAGPANAMPTPPPTGLSTTIGVGCRDGGPAESGEQGYLQARA